MGEDDPDRAKMDLVVRETARLEGMVKDILNFSRPLHLRASSCNLTQIAGECMEVMRCAEGGRGIMLEEALDPALPDCMLDKDWIKEVIINLIANAVQASPQGKSVTVRTLRRGRRPSWRFPISATASWMRTGKESFTPFSPERREEPVLD